MGLIEAEGNALVPTHRGRQALAAVPRATNPLDTDLEAAIGDDPRFVRDDAPWPVDSNAQSYYISTGSKGAAFTLRTRFWEWGGGRVPQKYQRDRYVMNLGPNASKAVAKLRKRFAGTDTPIYWTPIELAARAAAGPADELKFGKYKGFTLDEVAEGDPGYIVWLLASKDEDKSILQKPRYQSLRRAVEAMANDPRLAEALEERRQRDLEYQRKREQWAEEKRERERIKREAEAARARGAAAGHVGKPGKRQEFDVTFVMRRCWDSTYGQRCVFKFRDDEHREIVWFTGEGLWVPLPNDEGERPLEEGDRIRIKATVKEHGDYQGMPQTVVQRAKLVKVLELAPERDGNPAGTRQLIRLHYKASGLFDRLSDRDSVWVVIEDGRAIAAIRTEDWDAAPVMEEGWEEWFDVRVGPDDWREWAKAVPRRYRWFGFTEPCSTPVHCAKDKREIEAIKRRVLR